MGSIVMIVLEKIMRKSLNRYHRNIYFPPTFDDDVGALLKTIEKKHWLLGIHAAKKLIESLDKETARKVLSLIYHLKTNKDDIFEIYYNDVRIEKFCLRVSLDEQLDLILVVTKDKTIVTIYVNFKDHLHDDLDESLYKKE